MTPVESVCDPRMHVKCKSDNVIDHVSIYVLSMYWLMRLLTESTQAAAVAMVTW